MRLLPLDYSVRNLGRSPWRLFLAVAGSALVVLLLLVAGGFVRGMNFALGTSGGANNVVLMGAGSEESIERSEVPAAAAGIVAATVEGIRTNAGVAYVSPEVQVMLPVRAGAAEKRDSEGARQVMFRGVTPAAALVHDAVALTEGRWPRNGADEVMAGRTAHTVLGVRSGELGLGRSIIIDGRAWKVVGRFSAPGTVMEAEVWIPLEDIKTATKRETISSIVLTLEPYDAGTGEGAEFADIATFTKMRPDLELFAMMERDYYGKLAGFFRPIRIVAWLTAALIAVGGLFGGLNTLYAAFSSRIRELGTLQSIGFRRSAIAWSMIQEATLATASGGLLACVLGVFVLDGLAVRFSMGVFGLVIDETVVGLGLVSGLLLGVVGALPPAVRCLRPPIPMALKAV